MFPLARTERLSVRELPGETVVYDLVSNKVHCLNATSALVWKHCDGQTSLDQLAQIVEQEQFLSPGLPVVQLALEQLNRRDLLQTPVAPLAGAARLSRREALRKLAAAMVAIPVVMSITAPRALAQDSVVNLCTSDSDCPASNPCQTGSCQQSSSGGTIIFSCVFTAAANGSPCGVDQICSDGQCVPSVIR